MSIAIKKLKNHISAILLVFLLIKLMMRCNYQKIKKALSLTKVKNLKNVKQHVI